MSDIRYKHVYDSLKKEVSETSIDFFDMDGTKWNFTLGTGHRFEAEMNDWVAAGGVIEPADVPPQPA